MDNFEEIKPDIQEEEEVDALWISEDIRSYLYDAAKWTKFLSIIGFVFAALTAITALSANALIGAVTAVSPDSPLLKVGALGLTIGYLLLAFVIFYPSLQLFRFSMSTTQAVLFADQQSLSIAMKKLKSFFKFYGIMTIVFIGFYFLVIIASVLGGTALAGH